MPLRHEYSGFLQTSRHVLSTRQACAEKCGFVSLLIFMMRKVSLGLDDACRP
jgi:hypothetical protein